jgi:glycolate oxidase
MLPASVYKELEDAIGAENVSQEPAIMDSYAWQPALNVVREPWLNRPEAVVMPQTTEEVQTIVKICARAGIQFKPFSTGWVAWGGPGRPGVVQIDLRRMNRIIKIDEKNMFAVVEPYVIGSQLQAELIKRGLNCHIAGCGPNGSQLATVTSMHGYGWTGLTTSHSSRNCLGVEWVLPNGEILKIGAPGSGDDWFTGDGPGPSLRGVMRGWGGSLGGLGVFTKVAIKLFPWPGERKIECGTGTLLDLKCKVPLTHKAILAFSPSYKKFAEVAYKIGDSEIGYAHCKGTIGLFIQLLAPRAMKKILAIPELLSLAQTFNCCTMLLLACHTERELAYQEKVLRQIMEETGSFMMDLSHFPIHGAFAFGVHRTALTTAGAFRPSGDFLTSMGANTEYDCQVLGTKLSAEIKRKYIDKGVLLEDLADDGWGGIYEGTSNWGHMEQLAIFDRRDGKVNDRFEYLDDTLKLGISHSVGFGLSSMAAGYWKLFGPIMGNYHIYQSKIKQAFDPQNTTDDTWYIPPYDEAVEVEKAEHDIWEKFRKEAMEMAPKTKEELSLE